MLQATCSKVLRGKYFRVILTLFFLIPQISLAYGTNYQFTGQSLDKPSNLYYFNNRYYQANTGKFIQPDALVNYLAAPSLSNGDAQALEEFLADPQRLNSYSYAGNNPAIASDPTGLLTVIIPGTFYNAQEFSQTGSGKDFINAVSKTFNETHSTQVINDKNVWSGADNNEARQKAAAYITSLIKNYQFAPGEQLNIVGHSHGGNVGILVSQQTNRKIDNLVTLGTPVRPDYQPNSAMIGRHINAYSIIDMVQAFGGGNSNLPKLAGSLLFGPLGSWLGSIFNFGEFGLAGRMYKGAENINVTGQSKLGLIGAHFMPDMPAVWAKIDSLIRH